MKKIFCLLSFLFLTVSVSAQQQRFCGTQFYYEQRQESNSVVTLSREDIKKKLADFKAGKKNSTASTALSIIPVVVHVIYNTPEQDISDEQIISQIDALNEDFSATNANIPQIPGVWKSLIANLNIQFAFARRDENGNETTGITRTFTNNNPFSIGDQMKYDSTGGHSAWKTSDYFNIWVCNILSGSSIVLGFATYPLGDTLIDGVVINYKSFGRTGLNLLSQYNLGRTLTHEIGHWLDLNHIWADDGGGCTNDDGITDTPLQADASYGCPVFPHVSCNNGPGGDMFINYMDYTDDRCMMLFTQGQSDHMNNVLTVVRNTITQNSNAIPLTIPNTDAAIEINSPIGQICKSRISPVIAIKNKGQNPINELKFEWFVDDGSPVLESWSGNLSPGDSAFISVDDKKVGAGLHVFFARMVSVNNDSLDDYTLNNFNSRGFLMSAEAYGCPVYPETPQIKIYPVPSADIITIETNYKEAQKATLSIFNAIGKRVYAAEYENSTGEVLHANISGLAEGIYFVQVKTFDKSVTKKFIVQHE